MGNTSPDLSQALALVALTQILTQDPQFLTLLEREGKTLHQQPKPKPSGELTRRHKVQWDLKSAGENISEKF